VRSNLISGCWINWTHSTCLTPCHISRRQHGVVCRCRWNFKAVEMLRSRSCQEEEREGLTCCFQL